MKKTGKALNNIIKVVYILLAIIWVCWELLCVVAEYKSTVGTFAVVLIMAILVSGVLRLSKKAYKLIDAMILAGVSLVYLIYGLEGANKEIASLMFVPALVTFLASILIVLAAYKNKSIEENTKLSTGLDMVLKGLYIIAAAVWVIGSIYIFCRMKPELRQAGVQIIIYFIPLLIMLAVIGLGFYGLKKEKRSLLNPLAIVVLSWAEVLFVIINGNVIGGLDKGKVISKILAGYFFPGMALGLIGAIIVVVMIVRKKYSK